MVLIFEMSTERKTEPDEQSEGAQQIMQLPHSSQGSSGSLADSDTSDKLGAKRHRTRFTPHQLSTMESAFAEEKYPDMKARQELSEKLGLSEIQVQVWFQNKRAKSRRKDKRKRQAEESPSVTITPPPFWPKDIPFDTNIVDFYQKTAKATSTSAADNSSSSSSSSKTRQSQPVLPVTHSDGQQKTHSYLHYQTPHAEGKAAVASKPWLYGNVPSLPSGEHFSSSTTYESPPTEMFQSTAYLPFVQPEEDLFPLESAVHFQSQQRAGVYSQPQAGPSSSYGSSAMLPPVSGYEDIVPPLQPPVTLPPNPYNQPPY